MQTKNNHYVKLNPESISASNITRLMDLELPISVELGRKSMLVQDILELKPGTVIELKKILDEPVDIYVDNKKFAEGEVVKIKQKFGVRITALAGLGDRLPDSNTYK